MTQSPQDLDLMKHVHDAIIVPLEWAVAFISKIKSLKELNAALEPEVDARKSEVVELVEPKKSSSPELFDKQDSIGDKAGSQEADAHPKRQLMVYQVHETTDPAQREDGELGVKPYFSSKRKADEVMEDIGAESEGERRSVRPETLTIEGSSGWTRKPTTTSLV